MVTDISSLMLLRRVIGPLGHTILISSQVILRHSLHCLHLRLVGGQTGLRKWSGRIAGPPLLADTTQNLDPNMLLIQTDQFGPILISG